MLAALVSVATMVIQVPSPMGGHVNLGDCFVLLSGWLLGPVLGFAAGGVGSMMADILTGYAYWAPGTLLIKGAVAFAAGKLYRAMGRSRKAALLSGFPAEAIMIGGYFLYASLILGRGLSAAASVPGNFVQAGVAIAAGNLIMAGFRRAQIVKNLEDL